MTRENEWVVYSRDDQLRRTGVVPFERLFCNLRRLRGSITEVTAHHEDAGHLRAGDGLIVARGGATVMSGVIMSKQRQRNGARDEVSLMCLDDLGRLDWRLVYPDAALPADHADQPGRDIRTGAAEDVILDYVRLNAGPDALVTADEDRRLPHLTMAASESRGDTITGRGRWDNLLEFVEDLARRGNVGFSAKQLVGSSVITFEVSEPLERPGVRFGTEALTSTGELSMMELGVVRPELTWAIAGGRGELGDRMIRQDWKGVQDWGRVETFLDHRSAGDENDLPSQEAHLDDALGDALREGASSIGLDVEALATGAASWPTDYDLGDLVKVNVDGSVIWLEVDRLEVDVSAEGETVAPKLGDATRRQKIRLLRKIGELERTVARGGKN